MAKHEPMTIEGVTIRTLADAKRVNKKVGGFFFDKGTMQFWNSRMHTTRLIGLRYFISSEQSEGMPRRYRVREIRPNGSIYTVGDSYPSLEAAKNKAQALAKMGEGIPSNPVKAGYSIPTVQQNARKLMDEGRTQKEAVAIALKSARLSYRKAHPKGPFPERLKKPSAPCNQPKRKKPAKRS